MSIRTSKNPHTKTFVSVESGRSLLEMIAILALMVLLSWGAIQMYQSTMASNEANVIRDDIMLRGHLNKEGRPHQKKVFDTSVENKTRLGKEITYTEEASGYYYSYTMNEIKSTVCKQLIKKQFNGADRVKLNGTTYKVTTNGDITGNIKCAANDHNALTITFAKNTGAKGRYIPRTCTIDGDCPPTRRCEKGICADKCDPPCDPETKVCFRGTCVDKGETEKGNTCPATCCTCNQDNDVCLTCKADYYLDDNKTCISCPDHATCQSCSSASFTCKENFKRTTTETGCYCPAGYIINNADDTCSACTGNTISKEDATNCIDCGAGTANGDHTSCDCDGNATQGEDGVCYCNAGYTLNGTTCEPCNKGYYKESSGNGSCSACTTWRAHTTTKDTGKTSTDDCVCESPWSLSGTTCICPAGYGLVDGVCSACTEDNTISKANGRCVDCGAGKANEDHTSCDCDENATQGEDGVCYCNAGYTLNGTRCEPCDKGYYKESSGNGSCSACTTWRAHTTTKDTGKISTDDCVCDMGYKLENASCTVCPEGQFKNFIGDESCTPCTDPHATTDGTGKTSASDCVCDMGYKLENASCTVCPEGQFKNFIGDESCTPCTDPHATTDGTGKTSASDCVCAKGWEKFTQNPTCTAVATGWYKDVIGNSGAKKCSDWRAYTTTNGTAKTSTDDCVCAESRPVLDGTTCVQCTSSNTSYCTTARCGTMGEWLQGSKGISFDGYRDGDISCINNRCAVWVCGGGIRGVGDNKCNYGPDTSWFSVANCRTCYCTN